jgi:hypothetical protein
MNYNPVSGFLRCECCPVIMGGRGVHSHGVKATQHGPERYNKNNMVGWLWCVLLLNLIGIALHDSFTLVSAIDLHALRLQWLPSTKTVYGSSGTWFPYYCLQLFIYLYRKIWTQEIRFLRRVSGYTLRDHVRNAAMRSALQIYALD